MAGTMPHAIFIETGLDEVGTVAAYAAELPGCATFAATDEAAADGIPRRVARFLDWLRAMDEAAPAVVGDNWYEVERVAAGPGPEGRAAFSLDELPPSDEEWDRWRGWLELAREELAEAIDEAGLPAATDDPAMLTVVELDEALASSLGGPDRGSGDLIDRFYAAGDALVAALERSGPNGPGVRRALRLAIAEDLHLAGRLRGDEP